jgi:hypothetical protein
MRAALARGSACLPGMRVQVGMHNSRICTRRNHQMCNSRQPLFTMNAQVNDTAPSESWNSLKHTEKEIPIEYETSLGGEISYGRKSIFRQS